MGDNSVPKSEEEWKKVLTPEQYQVLRMKDPANTFMKSGG
jgi:peptide methionine sulfoxide reductase MsrB